MQDANSYFHAVLFLSILGTSVTAWWHWNGEQRGKLKQQLFTMRALLLKNKSIYITAFQRINI